MRHLLMISFVILLTASPVLARDIFVAPSDIDESNAPDGSRDRPWLSLAEAFRIGKPSDGDRVVLLEGNHGSLNIRGLRYDPPLVITSASQDRAHVDFIAVTSSSGIVIQDLDVWPREPGDLRAVASTTKDSTTIRFENLRIMSRPNADQHYLRWSAQDWTGPWRTHGIRMDGADNIATGNTIFGIDFGITTTGPNSRILGNRVFGFSGDALRSLGDDTVISGNRVENCVKVNKNHDDGFQAWAPRGKAAGSQSALSNLTITNNMILEWTGPSNHPLLCRMQGIGMFDGPYRDVRITNNVIVVSAYHGISIHGGHGVIITHNTVVHSNPNSGENFPWIRVNDQKGGAPASDLVVANNLAMGYANATSAPLPPFRLTNAQITRPFPLFENAQEHDYRPRADSGVIDAGKSAYAPDHDIIGQPRPQGNAPDLGAYEVQ